MVTPFFTERFMAVYSLSSRLVEALGSVLIPEAVQAAAESGSSSVSDGLTSLVPGNPFDAAAPGRPSPPPGVPRPFGSSRDPFSQGDPRTPGLPVHGLRLLAPLGIGDRAAFLLGSTLISFGSPPIPLGGGGFKALPLWIIPGEPSKGIVIKEAVKTIPDIFFTVLNPT
jgi:hypothetical protein